uniref:Ig-like domain-containing protein n=1 Tax=Scleropages formosus TaxID=113540 RepID=A0A8C9TWG4_SCLFO
AQTAPTSVFGLLPCGSGSGAELLSLGCLASGYFPADSVTFKWTDANGKSVSDFLQYPSVKSGATYSAVSQLQVKAADFGGEKSYKCTAVYPGGQKTEEQEPALYKSTLCTRNTKKLDIENQTATFACLARDFSPASHTFKWQKNGKDMGEGVTSYPETERKNGETLYSATSFLTLTETEWKKDKTTVTCIFSNKAGTFTKTVTQASSGNSPSVYLLAPGEPSQSEEVTLTCYAKNFYPKEVFIVWLEGDKPVEDETMYSSTSLIEMENTFAIYSRLTVRTKSWEGGVVYSCVVYHEAIPMSMKTIVRTIDNTSLKPTLVNLSTLLHGTHPWCIWSTATYQVQQCDGNEDGAGRTAVTFVILFLITLLYGVGATITKVMTVGLNGKNACLWIQVFMRYIFTNESIL